MNDLELCDLAQKLNSRLNILHETDCNVINVEIEIEMENFILVLTLDSEVDYIYYKKKVVIHSAYLQFVDFEADLRTDYFDKIENQLK